MEGLENDQDTSNKQDETDQAQGDEDKGIEMDEDFEGDIGDVGGEYSVLLLLLLLLLLF